MVKNQWKDNVLRHYKGYPAHFCYTSNWVLSYRICKGSGVKVRGKKTECVVTWDFPHCFLVCLNYRSKRPPTLHHAERNQSQTGTYFWTLPLPDRNSSCSQKSLLDVQLIHHFKAIGFKTEAAKLWFGNTLGFDRFPDWWLWLPF